MDRNLILKFAKINFKTSIFTFLSLSLSFYLLIIISGILQIDSKSFKHTIKLTIIYKLID